MRKSVLFLVLTSFTLFGCQSIERNAVKSNIHDSFESTMTRGVELGDWENYDEAMLHIVQWGIWTFVTGE